MSDLIYSLWHRSLGYSYFAMDVDFIEIREDRPMALIEASLCTPSFPSCTGQSGVFNRFLRETSGFQLEMAWWVARWLDVPAYVVCMNDPDKKIHILSLVNGKQLVVAEKQYIDFLDKMGKPDNEVERTLCEKPLELPYLLESFVKPFPGVKVYPYFKYREKWEMDYKQQLEAVENRKPRTLPKIVSTPSGYPVKGETTGERPMDYERLRSSSPYPFISLQWVEWRKDNPAQTIGRPAAILKTISINTDLYSFERAQEVFEDFKQSKDAIWWSVCAEKLIVPFYFVVFEALQSTNKIGDKFWVLDVTHPDSRPVCFSDKQEYANWIRGL